MYTRTTTVTRRFTAAMAVFAMVPVVLSALLWAQAPKQKITRAADLPHFSYTFEGKVEDLFKSEE